LATSTGEISSSSNAISAQERWLTKRLLREL
jgi:hypothetical protein